jgi:hypothetical protein
MKFGRAQEKRTPARQVDGDNLSAAPPRWPEFVLAAGVLAVLTLAMFAEALLAGPGQVLSRLGLDLSTEFLHSRQFGFAQLAQGKLALWNPHIYGGVPFLGNFQSALLYPPNWLHLILPLATAINVGIAVHVWLMGLWTWLWARGQGLHLAAALLAGVVTMFGGMFFLHVYGGQLSNLCTVVWVPLLLAAVDRCFDRPSLRWALVGTLAAAMMLLAGHPVFVLFTMIIAGLYVAARLGQQALGNRPAASPRASLKRAAVTLWPLLAMAALSAGLTAVQWLTGLEAAGQSVRAGGVDEATAGMFSFPPENFLTLLAPTFFGDGHSVQYWGRWGLSGMVLYLSVPGLVLAAWGAGLGRLAAKGAVLLCLAAALVLALGSHTPLFGLLFNHFPGMDLVRGPAKFNFHASLFLGLLAGAGLDRLIKAPPRRWWPLVALAAAGVALLAGSAWITGRSPEQWRALMQSLQPQGPRALLEVLVPPGLYGNASFLAASARLAANSLVWAGGLVLLSALLLALRRRWALAAYALALLAAGEVFGFAAQFRPTFRLADVVTHEDVPLADGDAQEYRVLNTFIPNEAMGANLYDAWGSGPEVRQRYAQFMYLAQREPVEEASQAGWFRHFDRTTLLRMVRLKGLLLRSSGGAHPFEQRTLADPMRRLNLVPHWQVLGSRAAIFQALLDPNYDPRQTVFLEKPPRFGELASLPSASATQAATAVQLIESTSDGLVISADVTAPGILLITDAYDSSWQVEALPGSAQRRYELVPGDYAFQAVPLAAGHHHLRIEYRPRAFVIGQWISGMALVLYAVLTAVACITGSGAPRHLRRAGAGSPDA